MKEFNREKDFNKIKNPRRNIIIFSLSLFLLVAFSTFIYKSYALFKINSEHVIINTMVGDFFTEQSFSYTGTVQTFTVPLTGNYNIELWGGGIGAYTKGTIYLVKGESLYFYVGQTSVGSQVVGMYEYGAWNGGSRGGTTSLYGGYREYSGSGATDVRLLKASPTDNTAWGTSESLRSRIMVAAGSGGGTPGTNAVANGGTLLGNNGTIWNQGAAASGYGATQTSSQIIAGGFGYGANGADNYVGGSGGGGGYYGGGGGYGSSTTSAYGGGSGSSYISGYAGVNSVEETGGTAAQPLHTNNTIHYSGKYFINGKMESGVNTGNGKAKISRVGDPQRTNAKLDNVRYIKSCHSSSQVNNSKSWVELQTIKDGVNVAYGKTVTGSHTASTVNPYSRITDGDITAAYYSMASNITTAENTCITVDLGQEYDLDEVALWLYYGDGRRYNDNVLSVGTTNTSGTTSLSTILHNYPGTTGYNETTEGRRYMVWD